MRIFIALLFEEENKDIIYHLKREVSGISKTGKFTTKDNLHLTILYLGEISLDELEVIYDSLRNIDIPKFNYVTTEIKAFTKSNSKKIVYLGVNKNQQLTDLYNYVRLQLKKSGFEINAKKYTPHITLGRKVVIDDNKSLKSIYCNKLLLQAKSISIMESTRIDNLLTYKELFSIPLK